LVAVMTLIAVIIAVGVVGVIAVVIMTVRLRIVVWRGLDLTAAEHPEEPLVGNLCSTRSPPCEKRGVS
jgi:hypothetical protein